VYDLDVSRLLDVCRSFPRTLTTPILPSNHLRLSSTPFSVPCWDSLILARAPTCRVLAVRYETVVSARHAAGVGYMEGLSTWRTTRRRKCCFRVLTALAEQNADSDRGVDEAGRIHSFG
jgi:hypothetical protein